MKTISSTKNINWGVEPKWEYYRDENNVIHFLYRGIDKNPRLARHGKPVIKAPCKIWIVNEGDELNFIEVEDKVIPKGILGAFQKSHIEVQEKRIKIVDTQEEFDEFVEHYRRTLVGGHKGFWRKYHVEPVQWIILEHSAIFLSRIGNYGRKIDKIVIMKEYDTINEGMHIVSKLKKFYKKNPLKPRWDNKRQKYGIGNSTDQDYHRLPGMKGNHKIHR